MRYLVRYRNGSSDYLDAPSANEARKRAEKDFGGKVTRVEVVKDCVDEGEDDWEDPEVEPEEEDEECEECDE